MEDKIYEIAVVGAGPAGSFLSYLLAKAKIKVVFIDKDIFPREKVCAGGLTPRALEILPFSLNPVLEKEISSFRLIYKNSHDLIKKYPKPLVYTVNRARFDYFLVKKAQKAGAIFSPGHEVKKISEKASFFQIQAGQKTLKAKIIVGADGANSFVAKMFNLKSEMIDIGLQYEIPYQHKKDIQVITLGWGLIPHSYSWVFPNNQFLAVGVGGPKKLGKKLKTYLDDWLKLLNLKKNHSPLKGHPMKHRLKKTPLVKENIVLIGDAAGLNDPLTGEGIFYAFKSAQMVAFHLQDYLTGNEKALKNYEQEINNKILPELKAAWFFNQISPIFFPIVFKLIRRNDDYWQLFCRLTRGEKTFLEMKKLLRPDRLIKKIYERKKATSKSSR
ncbi:geranylgeranyl reductase family protein [Candidatus Shapirobacteria bacterium]|nr:geranylgeranyl reductase family protein [Candidatus Shapirobacteria bacterium]